MPSRDLIGARLRAHLLAEPAETIASAAAHMLAVQAQEFVPARWALAVRSPGSPTLAQIDAAFESGALVRSWTQRGTLHIVPAADLAWVLSVTAARQTRAAIGVHREWGIDSRDVDVAERATRSALSGGNRLTRPEFAAVVAASGVDTSSSRGNHLLSALAVRGVLALGPLVPRAGGPTRDQYVVAADELDSPRVVSDPIAELFVGYVRSHGPASVADFRWWAGMPLGMARQAADAAGDRVVEVDDGLFALRDGGEPGVAASRVHALPAFDEYYLSYADRSGVCPLDRLPEVGPTRNGLVRPVLVAEGRVVGTWTHSLAVGRHTETPVAALWPGAGAAVAAEAGAALDAYAAFVSG